MTKQTIKRTAVEAGQTYRVPRRGKSARHIKITSVRGLHTGNPVAYYEEITRTGNSKAGDSIRHALTWDGKGWAMSPGFELVEA